MSKKSNAQDTTLRNNRAINRKVADLAERVRVLEKAVVQISNRTAKLTAKALLIAVVTLAASACGDFMLAQPSSTVMPKSPCQVAGSTVSILDQVPSCG